MRILVLLAAAVAGSGCAATCREMAVRRHAALEELSSGPGWHAALALPHAAVNRLIGQRLPAIPPLRLALPPPLGSLLPDLLVYTRRLALRPAPAGKVGFAVELEATLQGERAFGAIAFLAVAPLVNEKRELEVAIRPEDFESVRPVIDASALDRLVELIWPRLPESVRSLLPKSAVTAAASATISQLSTQLHRLLRATVLDKLGEVGHLRLALPSYLPVEELAFRPLGETTLLALVRTRLTVERGLDEKAAQADLAGAARFRAVLPGPALAALTNWAMAQHLLPDRFDSGARPQQDGPYVAQLRWRQGQRPLEARAWRLTDPPCAEIRIGGEPELRLQGSEVELGVRDARVEEVRGSKLIEAGVWLRTLFKDSFEITRKLATDSTFSIAGKPVKLKVVEGGVRDGRFWVGMDVL